MTKHDLIVVGGGTSGFIVAVGALRLGLKVIMIEKNPRWGGLSLHAGCVPSKSLLHVAHMVHNMRHAKQYGIDNSLSPINLHAVNTHINEVIKKVEFQEAQEIQSIFHNLGGKIIYGTARFIDNFTVQVNEQHLLAKKIVIATGSRPSLPSVRGLEQIGYITTDELLKQTMIWNKLIILGDKPSAIEYAQAFARLGSKVTMVVQGDSILPQEDPELVNKLMDVLLKQGIEIYLNAKVQNAFMQRKEKTLECLHDSGELFTVQADQVLVALGRKPNIEGLGLENAGVAYAPDGILVDRKLRTSAKNIYALGDVIRSPYKLTHVAEYQASILLSNMLLRYPATVKYQGFPYVIFTDPEYAHVGLTEQQAKEMGYKNIVVARFDFKDLDSAIINDTAYGLIKVITSKNRIVGASILGPHAGNLIAEWGLAINMRAKLSDVAATIHAYPTMAQINRRVASKQVARGFFTQENRTFVSLLNKFVFGTK